MSFRHSLTAALALALAPVGAALASATPPSSTDEARMVSASPRHDPAAAPRAPRGATGTDDARGVGREPSRSGPSAPRTRAIEGTDAARGIGAGPSAMLRPRG